MKSLLQRLADSTNPNSLAATIRRKRFGMFLDLVSTTEQILNRPLRIIDVGGTETFWEVIGYSSSHHHITLLNLTASTTRNRNIVSVAGDARKMTQFGDNSFDIVFSNSVIKHVVFYRSIKDGSRNKKSCSTLLCANS